MTFCRRKYTTYVIVIFLSLFIVPNDASAVVADEPQIRVEPYVDQLPKEPDSFTRHMFENATGYSVAKNNVKATLVAKPEHSAIELFLILETSREDILLQEQADFLRVLFNQVLNNNPHCDQFYLNIDPKYKRELFDRIDKIAIIQHGWEKNVANFIIDMIVKRDLAHEYSAVFIAKGFSVRTVSVEKISVDETLESHGLKVPVDAANITLSISK